MESLLWILEHWLDLLQSIGIIAGLAFTVHTARSEDKSRKISNVIAFHRQYQEIWSQLYEKPQLTRVLHKNVHLATAPITTEERLFVKFLVLHLSSIHTAIKEGMFVSLEGLQKDIRISFDSPIFRSVWEEMKPFQEKKFVEFIEDAKN